MNNIISLDQVFLKFHHIDVFNEVTLNIPEGSFYFLTGPSGSGKTSFLKMLYGALFPNMGIVSVAGRNIRGLGTEELTRFRKDLGLIFQDEKLLSELSVTDNIALPLLLRDIGYNEAIRRARELVEWVGLDRYSEASIDHLSTGQRQRVMIARAVISNPKIILADEPTANVDHENAFRMLHLFEELNRHGVTVIVATHDRALASSFSYPEMYIKDRSIKVLKTTRPPEFAEMSPSQKGLGEKGRVLSSNGETIL